MPRGKYARRRAARLREQIAVNNTIAVERENERAESLRSIARMHDRLGVPNTIDYPPADGIPDDGAFRASPELVDALLDTFERPAPTGPTREELERQSLGPLRDLARELGLKPGRVRKAELIDAILAKDWAVRNDG